MSTINERAKEYVDKKFVRIAEEMPIEEGMKTIFIESAKEQREIDIERAWQWMRNHIKLIGSEMELHSQFVKAMKDETDE